MLPALVKHWPDALRDDFEERAAIIEFMAHRTREDAEHMAEQQIRAREAARTEIA